MSNAVRSNFAASQSNLPPSNAAVPALDTTFVDLPRGIYVGTAGDVSLVMPSGNTVLYKNMAAGVTHAKIFSRINSAGTTATDLVVEW